MNLRRIHFLAVTAALTLSGYASPLHAGEKIQFSGSNNKEKNSDLAAPRTKPLMQTLDFKQLTGHGATVSPEQLAPIPPPQDVIIDPKLAEKGKKDRDWLHTDDKDGEKDANDREGKTGDRKKDKNNERERADGKLRDPFDTSTKSKYDLDTDSSPGGSTNRISFSSKDRRPDNPFENRTANGSLDGNSPGAWIGRPRGAQTNPFENNERSETLKMLGINPAGNQTADRQPSALSLINGSSTSPAGRPLDVMANKSDAFHQGNANPLNGREGSYKPASSGGNLGGAGFGGPNQSAQVYEPPKVERKPVVLPMPKRKF